MSTWIKDNKSIAAVIGIGSIAFIGLTALGIMQWMEKNDTLDQFTRARRAIEQASSLPQTPTKEGVEVRKKDTQEYKDLLADVEKGYEGFRPSAEEVSNVSPEEFRSLMVKTIEDYKKKATERNIKFKTDLRLGFDTYTSGPALQSATGLLKYQLAATNWLMEQVLDSDVVEITRVSRERFPQETEAPEEPKAGKNTRAASKPASTKMEDYKELPLSLTLRGKKGSIVSLINKITTAEKYLFTIQGFRTLTEKNGAQTISVAPAKSSTGQAANALNNAFGGASNANEEAPAEKEVTDILVQVVGNELVDYHIVLNLVVFPTKEAPPAENPATPEPSSETEE